MKNIFLGLCLLPILGYAQNNSYPTSGNVKIFAVDASWAEGIAIVKPSGWSGIRLTRNDPTSGNYAGNWAIGYNANTGNDFSISTFNSGQYDGVFHISNATRNVGIGTTSPTTRLNVVGGGLEISTAAHQADASLHISTSYGAYDRLTQINPSAANKPGLNLMASTNSSGGLNWWSWGVLTSGTWAIQPSTSFGGPTGLFVSANGNVGIGNSSPGVKLQVGINGSSTSYSSYTTSDISLSLQNTNATNNNLNILSYSDASGWGVADMGVITNHTNHTAKLFFSTRPSGAGPTQRMLIDENGNVGIGTLNPNQKLTVNGTIYGKEVKVDLSVPGPDYVFDSDYKLSSLEDIKSYIDENKHLPEVPSAKEMEANGINLSEMNMLLLKKVEELTLHAIKQQQNTEMLEQQLINQMKQIEELKELILKK